MPPFLAALFAVLGPILIKLLESWLQKEGPKVAKALEKAGKLDGLSDADKNRLVIEELIKKTPIRNFRRRAFLRTTRDDVIPLMEQGKKKLPAKVREELKLLVDDIESNDE